MQSKVLSTLVCNNTVFVSHSGQGEAPAAYGYSIETKNKVCQIVKKSLQTEATTLDDEAKTDICTHIHAKTYTQAHFLNLFDTPIPNVPEVLF